MNAAREEPQGNVNGAVDPDLQGASQVEPDQQPTQDDIVSVNSRKNGSGGSKGAKAAFILVVVVMVAGIAVFLGGHKLSEWKKSLKASTAKEKEAPQAVALNPEGTGKRSKTPALGAAAPEAAPRRPGEPAPDAAAADAAAIRPIMKDGRPVLNEKGEAIGVDPSGQVVTVPAIKLADGTAAPPLPTSGSTPRANTVNSTSNGQQPPSRYGGSFLTSASQSGSSAPSHEQQGAGNSANPPRAGGMSPAQQNALDVLRQMAAGQGGKADAGGSQGGGSMFAQPASPPNPDSVGAQLQQSATPVAVARRMPDQDLLLPKGRQIDCVLTGRIINELAGFTSCVLTQNLYSDNGRVLLLERGSEAIGEYGTGGPNGSRRLFVVWNRVKTPAGVEIDLMSPGADALGTSGHPGYLEQRWLERIGTALLISVMKDAVAIEAAKKAPAATVNSQNAPWSQTSATGQSLAEQILKQTINVRPTLYINEGERISIYVARDLDFSPVYRLRLAQSPQGGTPR